MSNILTEVKKYNIITELSTSNSGDNYIPYMIPHYIPGSNIGSVSKILTIVRKYNINTESNGI